MSPESAHKLMGFYVEALKLGIMCPLVHSFCLFKLFPIGCIGLIFRACQHGCVKLSLKYIVRYLCPILSSKRPSSYKRSPPFLMILWFTYILHV